MSLPPSFNPKKKGVEEDKDNNIPRRVAGCRLGSGKQVVLSVGAGPVLLACPRAGGTVAGASLILVGRSQASGGAGTAHAPPTHITFLLRIFGVLMYLVVVVGSSADVGSCRG